MRRTLMDISNPDAAVIEMMAKAEKTVEEKKAEILSAGDDTSPKMTLKMKNAGHTPMYDTKTGEMSESLNNMLGAQLKKKHKDGTPRFTVHDPHIVGVRGKFKCMLHKDGEEREFYDSLFLPICNKDNITSPFQVRRHMEKRHKMEWASIKEEIEKKEKAEDRAERRAMTAALVGKVEKVVEKEAPLYVSSKDKIK